MLNDNSAVASNAATGNSITVVVTVDSSTGACSIKSINGQTNNLTTVYFHILPQYETAGGAEGHYDSASTQHSITIAKV